MTDREVKSRLCYHDRRNPDFSITEENGYDKEDIEATGDFAKPECYCDNCFYGRTKLANYILNIREMLIQGALTKMSCSSAIVELDKIIKDA